MKKTNILLILIIVTLLAVTTPVAAVSLHVDLGKTYKSHLMNITYIDAIDIWDLSQSQSQVLTTDGTGNDIQTLHNPTFNTLTRNFFPTTGTATHANVTVSGANFSTVDWTTLPAYQFYITPKVPTIRQKIPGKEGNPLVSKYNASWVTGSGSDFGLFLASDQINLYNTSSILNINATNNIYTAFGSFTAADYNQNNLPYTLTRNLIAVDDFSSSASAANLMGNAHPEMRANTGSYFINTIEDNEPAQTVNVYSVYRVVALKAPTPLTWMNSSTTYTANQYTYFKGSNQNVVLSFNVSGPNPDITSIKNITYLIIDRTASYDLNMNVDTNKVAENAESQWQNSLSSGQVIDLLYATLANDARLPFTYTINATGVATAASKTYSNIAITPGYGISGNTTARLVTVPGAALESLHTGYYDIYLMGTNSRNEVVALDQKQVRVVPAVIPSTFKVGVYRPSTHSFYLDYNGNGKWDTAAIDKQNNFGLTGDLPATGVWNFGGKTEIGVFRPTTHSFYIDYNGNGKWDMVPVDKVFNFGLPGDLPTTGDWINDGKTEIGVYRPLTHSFYLDYNGNGKWDMVPVDKVFNFGLTGDIPATGDWNLDGNTEIGVYRPSTHSFYIDYNGNGKWDGVPVDKVYNFGLSVDLPATGNWV